MPPDDSDAPRQKRAGDRSRAVSESRAPAKCPGAAGKQQSDCRGDRRNLRIRHTGIFFQKVQAAYRRTAATVQKSLKSKRKYGFSDFARLKNLQFGQQYHTGGIPGQNNLSPILMEQQRKTASTVSEKKCTAESAVAGKTGDPVQRKG